MLIPQVVVDTVRSPDDQDLHIACLWLGFVFALETLDLPQCASFPRSPPSLSPSSHAKVLFSQFVNLVINRIVSNLSGWEMPAISSGLKV